MKLVVLSTCLLLWILCLQQYCFLGTVEAAVPIGKELGQNCTSATDCLALNATCPNGTCDCTSGFYQNLTMCLPQKDLGQNCTSASDCFALNATCLNGICDCTPGFYQNLTMCLPQHDIFESCDHPEECLGDNVGCNQNNCTCNDEYYFENSNCTKKKDLGQNCTSASDCFALNATCLNGICDCTPGFYQNLTMCLPQRDIFESCDHPEECLGDNVGCNQNNCTCNDEYYFENGNCTKKHDIFESCNRPEECLGDNVECNQNNCTCNDEYYFENGNCHKKKEIEGKCTSTSECWDPHAICKYGICKCGARYFYKDKCLPKHGIFESCDQREECLGDNVDCNENNCTCDEQYYFKNGNCHGRLEVGSKCDFDRMCSMLSVCKDDKCICKEGYYHAVTTCFKKSPYDGVCDPGSCMGENTYCRGRCRCKDEYEYIESVCQKKSSSKAVIIIVVLLIIILLCLLGYILWKIKKQKSEVFKPPNAVTQVELDIPRSRPILMSKFPETVDIMHQDSNKIFSENFLDLGRINPLILTENSDLRSQTRKYLPCNEATKPVNATKNRFLDILPFDHSRVKLKPVDDDAASDYINASYISGYSREKEYIAAQGPLSNTSSDFWRMVWQEKVSIIVMLTLCREKELNKCDNYWPLLKGDKLDFDDITIETTNETHYDSYDYRSMILKIDETTRTLKHFHFMQWADFSANVPVEILIDFIRNVRSHITSSAPVVVHCSAGVGRTGTFIAVDYMLQFVDANPLDSNIDIFQFVSKMRANRVHMVQNEKQYILVHDCIKHIVKKSMSLENGESDGNEVNPYENQGFVTIDLTEKGPDEKPAQDLGSVEMIIVEEKEEENEEVIDLEENPYENEIQVVPNAEKDGVNDTDSEENPYDIPENVVPNAEKDGLKDTDSEENPYDIPENAVLINKNKEDKQLDDSDKPASAEPKPVIIEAEEAEEENPYENQEFADPDEKQMLTKL